jgi:Fe-S-cluster containining protein
MSDDAGSQPNLWQDSKSELNSKTIGPCENCGLCCEHLLVMPNALDVLREPRIEAERPLGKISLPILEASWLLAGPGKPCPFLTPKKHCGIYPTRPNVCVSFIAGSAKCLELRDEHAMPPVILESSATKILADIVREALDAEDDSLQGL